MALLLGALLLASGHCTGTLLALFAEKKPSESQSFCTYRLRRAPIKVLVKNKPLEFLNQSSHILTLEFLILIPVLIS